MPYYKTALNDDIILFEGDEGNAAGIELSGFNAKLLYTDMDPVLLDTVEKECASKGMKMIEFNYFEKYRELSEFLKLRGYLFKKSKRILSVSLNNIFESKGVQKSIKIDFPGTRFVPIRELFINQVNELWDFLGNANIPLSKEDIVRFNEDLSGISYSDDTGIKAVLLSSTQGEDIVIECLYSGKNGDPKYIMSALSGFAREIKSCGYMDIYSRIVVIENNVTIRPLLRRLLDKRFEINDEGIVIHAGKNIDSKDYKDVLKADASDKVRSQGIKMAFYRKLRSNKYQNNINWKTHWSV